ncbi:VOC family protein [Streptomyces sp. NPDC001595]|uniref:VOC family protein n=1 Tax=Streptomyces sp. NPDC001532 TaxID=3154520 RepID=UPI00331B0155
MNWSHVALNCARISVTEEFYTRWFGFRRARAFELGDVRIVFLRLGDSYLELFGPAREPEPAAAAPPASPEADGPQLLGTVRHIAFQTDDVPGFLERMGEHAHITLGPLDFSEFIEGWRSVWITDPDGVVVEVSQGYKDPSDAGADAAAPVG